MDMSERIKGVRKKEGLRQEEFADMLGITRDYVTKLETARQGPSKQLILNICRTFDINGEWLKEGKGQMHNNKSPDINNNRIINYINRKIPPEQRPLFIDTIIDLTDISRDKLNSTLSNLRIFTEIYKSEDKKKIRALTAFLEVINPKE